MEEFPSGQRGQTVNLLRLASVVRIHPPPPRQSKRHIACSDFLLKSERAHSAALPLQTEPALLGFGLVPPPAASFPGAPFKSCRFSFVWWIRKPAPGDVLAAHHSRRGFFQNSPPSPPCQSKWLFVCSRRFFPSAFSSSFRSVPLRRIELMFYFLFILPLPLCIVNTTFLC